MYIKKGMHTTILHINSLCLHLEEHLMQVLLLDSDKWKMKESNLVTPTWQNTGPHCTEEKNLLALVLGKLLPSLCTRRGQSQPFHAVEDSILGLPFL